MICKLNDPFTIIYIFSFYNFPLFVCLYECFLLPHFSPFLNTNIYSKKNKIWPDLLRIVEIVIPKYLYQIGTLIGA